MSELQEIQYDLEELQQLLGNVKRKGNIDLIQNRIRLIESEIKQKTAQKPPQKQQQQQEQDNLLYNAITKYAWDQEGKKVKIIFSLEGIGSIPKENIISQFNDESVDLKIKDYKNQNLRFGVKRLNQKIKVPECSFKVSNNTLYLYLTKQDGSKHWDQLAYKEQLVNPEKIEKEDPQASLMNMMKEMYQNGDEDMKRTIAQAWTKSQEEKLKGGI
ncbi:hypothetical protein pb186bvf_005721 [Paramecium bursaria]